MLLDGAAGLLPVNDIAIAILLTGRCRRCDVGDFLGIRMLTADLGDAGV